MFLKAIFHGSMAGFDVFTERCNIFGKRFFICCGCISTEHQARAEEPSYDGYKVKSVNVSHLVLIFLNVLKYYLYFRLQRADKAKAEGSEPLYHGFFFNRSVRMLLGIAEKQRPENSFIFF